jgi:type I restriction enzyme S subunit
MVTTTQNKQIRPGYKQSELGIIPDDWDTPLLGDLFLFKNGLNKSKQYFGYGTPIVNYMDVYNLSGIRSVDIHGRVSLNKQELKNFEVRKGDVLFTRTSETVDEVGIASVILDELEDTVFSGFVLRARPKDDSLEDAFKKYCFASATIRDQITSKSTYTTRALTNGRVLSAVVLARPKKHEQLTIATALTDIDTLIVSLEKLIAKKRAIKQGAMQELLTGKRRLPGFSGKWTTKRLAEIGEVTGSGVDKKIRPDELPVRLVNYLDVFHRDFIYAKELNHWVTATSAQAQRCTVKKGDVFFTPSSEMRYDIAISAVAMEDIPDAVYSYHLVRLRMFEDWDLPFRVYAFKTKDFLDQAETICEGSGKRYVISLPKFRAMTIFCPPTLAEQSAIAAILWDMDSEVARLQQQLAKLRLLKQGMMQVLLTGKIRLF